MDIRGFLIDSLGLSPRAMKAMEKNDIATVGDLLDRLTVMGQMALRGPKEGGLARLGPGTIAEVLAALARQGITITLGPRSATINMPAETAERPTSPAVGPSGQDVADAFAEYVLAVISLRPDYLEELARRLLPFLRKLALKEVLGAGGKGGDGLE